MFNVFMIFYYEPYFVEKLLWESGFSNFHQTLNDAKRKSVIGRHFEMLSFFILFFRLNMLIFSV